MNILLVEDDPVYQAALRMLLRGDDLDFTCVASLADGQYEAAAGQYDACLLDLGLPDSFGIETFLAFSTLNPQVPVVILSSLDDERLAAEAVQAGAQDYLIKTPALLQGDGNRIHILRALRYAVERHQIRRALVEERNLLEERVLDRTTELRNANILLREELDERKRYEFIANTFRDTLSLIDRAYCYQAVNDAFCRAWGKSREQIVGAQVQTIWSKQRYLSAIKPRLDLAFAGQENEYSGWMTFGSLGTRFFVITFYPFHNSQGDVTHVVVVSRDETTREQVEERLRQFNYSLHVLRQIDQASLAVRTPEDIARMALERFWRLVPYDQADLVIFGEDGQDSLVVSGCIEGHVSSHHRPVDEHIFTRHEDLLAGRAVILDCSEDAAEVWKMQCSSRQGSLGACFVAPLIAETRLIGVILMGSEEDKAFTEEHIENTLALSGQLSLMLHNALLFKRIELANANLRALAGRLVSAQEDERRRISMELHDEAGQSLTALKISLALLQSELEDALPGDGPRTRRLRGQLGESIHLTEATLEMLRSLAHDLRPPSLETVGLNQTMKDFCARVRRQTRLKISYRGMDMSSLPGHIQVSLYRVLQEALTNVIKHAHAERVKVSLARREQHVSLRIQDDGVGFTPALNGVKDHQHGIGLIGIQERMQALGGRLEVVSQLQQGAILTVTIPLGEME